MTDLIFTVGGLAFILALLPTVFSKTAVVPLKTSVLTAAVLTAFIPNYMALRLTYSAASTALSALCWWFIAYKRRMVQIDDV